MSEAESTATPNALGFTVDQYTDEIGNWSPALKTAVYDQAYESSCSVVFRAGVPTTPAGFLNIAYAIACAAVAGMALAGYVTVEDKGRASDDELAKKRAEKDGHSQPTLPFGDEQGFHMQVRRAGGYL